MKSAVRPALFRFAFIDERLRSQSWPNASSLARELEVTSRTIHRDVEFMRDRFHAPIAYDSRQKGFCYSDASYRLPFVSASEGECIALFLAERLLQQYGGTPFAADITRLFHKMTDLLTEPITINLQHLSDSISFRQHSTDLGDVRRFDRLSQASRDSRQLEIVYWTPSRNETCCRVVDPYHLASIDGDWFLVAYCHLREDVRMFSPGRIRELHETGKTFARPADFHINDYLDVGFRKMRGSGPTQTICLRFTSTAAHLIRERIWHSTQQLADHADGSLTLTFRVNQLAEVKRWVLSFGAECKVLEPRQLREQIYSEAKRILGELLQRLSAVIE